MYPFNRSREFEVPKKSSHKAVFGIRKFKGLNGAGLNQRVQRQWDIFVSFEMERIFPVRKVPDLTTLSTGSIALEIAFLEKLFVHPKWKVFIAFSLLSFAVSIVTSLICYVILVSLSSYAITPIKEAAARQNVAFIVLTMAIAGFLIGVCTTIVFVLRNLFVLS